MSGPGERLLIVTADDFGLTAGVSRGVVRAHREGIVTTASLLAVGQGFEVAAALARDEPSLGIGAHLAIVGEDRPLLASHEIRTLVGRDGRFPASWRTVLLRGLAGRIDPADVGRELSAQLRRIEDAGLTVAHVDTHQHVHLVPAIGDVVLDLAGRHGIAGVRVPASARTLPWGAGVNALARRLRASVARAGLVATEGYAGLDEAGRLDRAELERSLTRLVRSGARTAELNAHPGERDDPDLARFAWGYGWDRELDALVHPATQTLPAALGFRLGRYADLRPAGASR